MGGNLSDIAQVDMKGQSSSLSIMASYATEEEVDRIG